MGRGEISTPAMCSLEPAEPAEAGTGDSGWRAGLGRVRAAHAYSWVLSRLLSTWLPLFLSL